MKIHLNTFLFTLALILFGTISVQAQTFPGSSNPSWKKSDPWKRTQLMQASDLASLIKDPKAKKPLIYNIGVVQNVKGAINLGAASEKGNLELLKKRLKGLPKTTFLVVYCGCCPFDKCPNIRPAIRVINEMGFINAKLLNLPTNIKVDWKDKGYPM
jgi:hypothetical protein